MVSAPHLVLDSLKPSALKVSAVGSEGLQEGGWGTHMPAWLRRKLMEARAFGGTGSTPGWAGVFL